MNKTSLFGKFSSTKATSNTASSFRLRMKTRQNAVFYRDFVAQLNASKLSAANSQFNVDTSQ